MRIELRQIGVRDEAKMLGGIGTCGKSLCCASWLGEFDPVSIKMAKVQSFADKAKGKKKVEGVTVKVIKSMKTDGGAYKFNEKFVKLADISKVTDIK